MRINKSRRQAVQASYSPALLDSLIEQYSDQYSYDTHETIWETIYEKYKDSGLADDVLAALEDQDDDEYFDEEYYDGFADDLFGSSEKYDAEMTGGVFASESKASWDDMSWPDQIKYMKNYVRKYKGTRVFEDFADHIGVDVMDIIDSFTDAESHGDIKIPRSKQKDSEFANDDIYCSEDAADYEDEIQEIGQEFTSENTSINSGKLPTVFKMVSFEPGTVNIDYGGGRFDNVAEYLKDFDVINLVYDPYNRSKEHNQDVIRLVREHGGADTATCSNVLNVIKEPEVRLNVLSNIKKLVKPSGTVYITVYEGSGKGNEGPTKSGYQLNRKTADYLEEIQKVFPDASRKGKLIVAHPSGSPVTSSTQTFGEFVNDYYGWEIDLGDLSDEDYDMLQEMYGSQKTDINATSGNEEMNGDLGAKIQDEGNKIVRKYLMDTFGYQEVETYDIGQVSCFDPEDGTIEVSLNLYNMEEVDDTQIHELINLLDKMILQYDSNASFELDLQMPGYAEAIVNVNDSVNSSESIEAVEDPRLDPPEYDEPDVLPDMEEVAEVDLDAVIIIDDKGSWDYEDTSYAWAAASDDEADLYSDEYPDIMLSDHVGVVEKVDDLMITLLPEVPGRYRVQGTVELVFDISGVEHTTSNGFWDDLHGLEYDEEVYTDSATASFNLGKSSIRDFKCTPINSEVSVESSTTIEGASWSFGEQKSSPAGKYTTFCVVKKNGPGYIRYAFRDNGLTDLQRIQNDYIFSLSKLSPYDDADYVWCYYKDGAIIYVKNGKRIDTEFPAPDPDDYETFNEFIDDIVIQALETLEYYNSKIKSVMVHN